ncbi:Hpt domain-containing protein [Sulfurimonas sp. SAG-AH-194-I05]|nr:Hpt domain-containing protein [Sulfurimonas sp. SAG-AH-194-I05]MDF1875327.1 Hpt domain-containing protein [Sulfurimonas sp. SAG-AH-194-I05]
MNIVNLQAIADELDFDLEDIKMVLTSFLKDSVLNLTNMIHAIDTEDYNTLRLSAHAIKGSASNILLHEIVEITADIEKNAFEKNTVDYSKRYLKLKSLIKGLRNE